MVAGILLNTNNGHDLLYFYIPVKKRKFKLGDILLILFIALLLIPQTRKPIQVAINRLKIAVWSPGIQDVDDREQMQAFQYAVRDLNGAPKTISIGQGTVSFISYWATWCAPCIAELPGIQKLYTDYGDRVNFLLLTQEDTEIVQRFLDKKAYELPVYFPQMQTPELLRETSIPINYIIDAQGNIVIKETGAADWDSQRLREMIDGLLLD